MHAKQAQACTISIIILNLQILAYFARMSSTISVLPESSKLSQAIWRTLKPSSSFLTFGSKIDNLN